MTITHIDCSKTVIEPFPITVIVSRFNTPVTERLLNSALRRLNELNFPEEFIRVVHVPGAVEIPLVCKRIASAGTARAIVTLGAVIRGETTHYDYVCQYAADGCLAVSMEYELPVVFGVLTTENGEQAFARSGGEHSDKGRESVDTALEMVQVMDQLTRA